MLWLPHRRSFSTAVLAAALVVFAAVGALARPVIQPLHAGNDVAPLEQVDLFRADVVEAASLLNEDILREREGLPPRFALPQEVFIAPDTHGTWEQVSESTLAWRLVIESPGALSLNLGFTRCVIPQASHLNVYPLDGSAAPVTFTALDNKAHGELWTPILDTDAMVVEVVLPVKERWNLELELTSVNVGYKPFGQLAPEVADKQGTCNNDVVCPEGDGWRDDIQSVAAYSTGGSIFCTGAMVNNTSEDETPYFLTADHCGLNSSNDASLVVYWNFHSPNCGDLSGGSLTDFQTGSTFRAEYATSDMTLMELDAIPDPAHEVAYAGWDRSGADATSAVAIHHPNGDEKAISFEYDATTITSYLGSAVPGNGSHVRVIDWDDGTTEPGSSGSPLFDQNHRVIGQLHGGYAACGNDESDWYGRIYTSWTGGGSAASRLSDWLDPTGTGAMTTDVLAPYAAGLGVSGGTLSASGDVGGPFAPSSIAFTLTNRYDATTIGFSASADVNWLDVAPASGTLAPGAQATVTVTINSQADLLAIGSYLGTVSFVNTTDGIGDAQRTANLQVGVPSMIMGWNMDTNPGWTTQGQWAYGIPTGSGGQYGNADPTGGATGSYVYGYNLAGDYANSLPETHLTTTAIDCTDLASVTLKFMRWLNVEQPTYDHASIYVSNDNVTWTQVWTNGAEITDNAWSQVEYDISAVADGQATVYVRWTQGTTDGSWQYSGWNIDDVEIWALDLNTATPVETPRAAVLHPVSPNPFNPMTRVAFELPRQQDARVAVYDLRGQLVKVLHDGVLGAGSHTVQWDGTDASGRSVSSGGYLFRLVSGDVVQVRKASLIR